MADSAAYRKKKGKTKQGELDDNIGKETVDLHKRLSTLDIFAGCGGLSEGLQRAGKFLIQFLQQATQARL